MSDEDASLAVHVGTVAVVRCTDTQDKCNSINNKSHEKAANCATTSICIEKIVDAAIVDTTADDNDSNECKQVDLKLTIPTSTIAMTTLRRPNASPTVIITTPSIAITSAAADSSDATSALASTTKRTCKRTGKIDFVRFDSVETVYNQTDHDEVIRRATIKDEIKRYVSIALSLSNSFSLRHLPRLL